MQNLTEHIDNEAVVEECVHANAIDFDSDSYYYDSNDGNLCWISDCDEDPPSVNDIAPPKVDEWEDVMPSAASTKFTIDSAKDTQWRYAKDELKHATVTMKKLFTKSATDNNIIFEDIIRYIFGLESVFAVTFKESLNLSNQAYLKFMSTAITVLASAW